MKTPAPQAAGSPNGDHPLLASGYKHWLVFVLFLVSINNFSDRAILAVLAQPIKEDLLLTDTQLGILQGLGFAILYSVMGVPLGMLAERVNRTRLIAACIAVWSAMTVACGLATNFITLLLGRIGVGIGEAGAQPCTNSLLSDHFPSDRRGSVLAIIALGAPFGFLMGQAIGGWVASEWGWRAGFYAMGIPGLIVALIAWLTLREPPRGLADGYTTVTSAPSLKAVLSTLASKRSYLHVLAAFTVSGFALNSIANFVLPFYLRGFDVPLATLGVLFGFVTFTSNGLGMLVSGFGFDWLSRRDRRWMVWGPAIVMTLCIPIYFGAFISQTVLISLAFIWFANFFVIMFMAPTMATIQNLVGPRMRATTTAITALVGGLLGTGLGPTVLGMLSDFYAKRAFIAGSNFIASCPGGRSPDGPGSAMDIACLAASTTGLRYALITVLVAFVWAAVHYLLAARSLQADLYDPAKDEQIASRNGS